MFKIWIKLAVDLVARQIRQKLLVLTELTGASPNLAEVS